MIEIGDKILSKKRFLSLLIIGINKRKGKKGIIKKNHFKVSLNPGNNKFVPVFT